MNDLTIAAVAYLAEGFHLLALKGKRPNPNLHASWDWENSIHGLPESPEDEAALDRAFDYFLSGTTGVGILIPQHVLVADIDTEEAAALYMDLAGALPETRVSKTPNGLHVWFVAPGADQSVWLGGRTLLFKGFGGYVAAPPSRHFDEAGHEDGVYTWVGEWAGPYDFLPERVERAIRDTRAMDRLDSAYKDVPRERNLVPIMVDGSWTGKGYGVTDITGLCKAIINAPDGNQNSVIHWAACVCLEEGVPFNITMEQLLAAAIEGNHPEHRARATIAGVYKRGHRA